MTNEIKINFWYLEGLRLFAEWVKTKDETAWGAFGCCAAAIVEFDRAQKDKRTQKLQSLVWRYAWAIGECPLERWKNSGYFDEEFFEKNS